MIFIKYNKYGVLDLIDSQDEIIFKGNNKTNKIFITFDNIDFNVNHYLTYSALVNDKDYEGNLTDLASVKTKYNYKGVEYSGYTFALFSNLTAKAGELKLSVRLVDKQTDEILVSGIVSLIVQDTAVATYNNVDITKTQYNALLTAFDELSQSIDATNFKTINGESIYGEGDIVVLTGDYMEYYVNQQISNVYDSIYGISSLVVELQQSNAELNALIEKQEKKIKQLELASEGNILSTITESDSAYEVNVGVDTLPYATIDKIGGMTYKSNNLCNQATTQPLSNGYFNTSQGAFGHVEKGKQYTFSLKYESSVNTSKSIGLRAMSSSDGTGTNNGNLSTLQLTKGQRTSVTFTASYSGYIGFNGSGFDTNDKFVDITLNNSSNDLGYQPYFEGLRDSKVTEIISAGANLINPSDLTYIESATLQKDGSFLSSSLKSWGSIKLNTSYNASASADRSKNGINFKKGTYYISIKAKLISGNSCNINSLFVTRENIKQISSSFVTKPSSLTGVYQEYKGTFTLDSDDKIGIVIQVDTNASNSVIQIKDIMIAKESIDYKPYKQPTAIAIPTAIQNLDGYGLGVDATYYNYVDFESKKFVRNVKKIVLDGSSDEVYGVSTADNGNGIANFSITFSSLGLPNYISNGTIDWYIANREEQLTTQANTTTEGVYLNASTLFIRVKSTTANTISQLRTYLANNPVIVIYAVETPVAEGLSHIIDGEILTEVESGGALTFENEYKQDVPFTWTFQEKL